MVNRRHPAALPNPRLTAEDLAIMLRLTVLDPTRTVFSLPYLGYSQADQRDADLMLFAQQLASCGPAGFELYGIPCRGWTLGVLSPKRFADLVSSHLP